MEWHLSDDTYATINASGVLTVRSTLPATYATTTVGYTATHTASGTVVEASLPVTIYASEAVLENIVGGEQGRSGGVVTLNDYEDHTWSYYSDATLPARMRSLDPANVKITYYGNGNNVSTSTAAAPALSTFTAASTSVQVGIGEPEHTFVYYKTLERTSGSAYGSAGYDYTTIPNPFSVRPTYGSGDTRWRGFYAWRIKSVSGGAISGKAAGDTIHAESTVSFVPSAEYGMTVELEALWAAAEVSTSGSFSSGYNSVERNFYVGTSNVFTGTNPCTCSSFYPNGTTNGTTAATLGNRSTIQTGTAGADKRVEYYIFNGGTLNTGGHKVTIGRGVTSSSNPTITPLSGTFSAAADARLRIESGSYGGTTSLYGTPSVGNNLVHLDLIFGSDYDRATGNNDNLSISQSGTIQHGSHTATGSSWLSFQHLDILVKSGKIQADYWEQNSATYSYSFYCRSTLQTAGYYPGITYLTIEGGEFASINGGRGNYRENVAEETDIVFSLRMKDGTIHGSIYGAASANPSFGGRRMLITGGTVEGWIAGGCDGTSNGGGATIGSSYIYVGGDAVIGTSTRGDIDGTPAGNIFGAGRGMSNHGTDGEPASMKDAFIAVADEATVLRNVYGGGDYGYTGYSSSSSVTDANTAANIYILGGTVEQNVFGGGNNSKGTNATITMTGGLVKGGIYGGSNTSGTMHYNTTLHINGGQVGTSSGDANVHGGGYGASTAVNGDVTVTVGDTPANSGGATVYGNVYGGSALGTVNTSGSNTTTVTLNRGTINGNLFGGALGEGANVHGKITVTMNGGTVTDGVYGGGDAAAYSPSSNHPVVNMTGGNAGNVFGGGRGATAIVTGNPQVTLSGTATVSGNVYGGGNAAEVHGDTNVILKD
ncbi:MAG: hypothetical protein IJ524_00420 [Bacteroidales bacterium]|nr:hypothetical protein [Bacteroidales bacterium]